jgi:hypothetical protein
MPNSVTWSRDVLDSQLLPRKDAAIAVSENTFHHHTHFPANKIIIII